jgi:hypothetical protein
MRGCDTGRAGVAIAAPWLDDDPRASPLSHVSRIVARSVINYQHLMHEPGR